MRRLLLVSFALQAIAALSFGQVPTNGLIAYYPFNGNAIDESGNGNNGTIWGTTLTTDRFGKANSAFDFNGTNNYIEIADTKSLRPALLSITGWIYPRVSNIGNFVYKSSYGTAANEEYACVLTSSSLLNGGIKRNSNCQPAAGWVQVSSSQTIPINQWKFTCLTWDGTLLRMYLNGVLIATNTAGPAGPIDSCSGGTLRLGIGWDANSPFNGKLDDFRFYNRALADSEIAALYHEGGWDSLNQGLVAYYPFSGNANDSSGNGNNGTINGATLSTDRFGAANRSYHFDGSSNYISIADNASLHATNAVTISAWINLDSNVVRDSKTVISKGATPGVNADWTMIIDNTNPVGSMRIRPHMWLANGWRYFNGSTDLQPLKWYHVVMTYDGATMKSYVNGVSDGSMIVAGTIKISLEPVLIGLYNMATAPAWFPGQIDDIRIYTRALSVAEIGLLYHEEGWAVTGVKESVGLDYPSNVEISQNYPNPFNPSTTIRYALPQRSHVTLSVFNTLGQIVATIVNGEQEAGYHDTQFDGTNIASGVYFYRIQAGDFVQTKRLLLLR